MLWFAWQASAVVFLPSRFSMLDLVGWLVGGCAWVGVQASECASEGWGRGQDVKCKPSGNIAGVSMSTELL